MHISWHHFKTMNLLDTDKHLSMQKNKLSTGEEIYV